MMRNTDYNDNGDITDLSDTGQVSGRYLKIADLIELAIGTRLEGSIGRYYSAGQYRSRQRI